MAEILLVQENLPSSKSLRAQLAHQDILVTACSDSKLGSKLARQLRFQIIIISHSPEIDAYSLCQTIRGQRIDTPIIVLDKLNLDNLQRMVDVEGDVLISKPVNSQELVLRIHHLLRRTPRSANKTIKYADLMLDCEAFKLYFADQPIELRRKELQVLTLLLKNRHRVFTREQILNFTNEIGQDADTTVVDVHISNIRKQFKLVGIKDIIQTVHGIGYAIR